MRITLLLPLVVHLLTGCFLQNVSAEERFRDTVYELNDDLRWSRMNVVTERVSPAFRGHFLRSHHAWGRQIQIADSEVLHMELATNKEAAVSVIAFGWYTQDTMMLRQTTLRQRWKRANGRFVLVREEVVDGDAKLIAPPARPPS